MVITHFMMDSELQTSRVERKKRTPGEEAEDSGPDSPIQRFRVEDFQRVIGQICTSTRITERWTRIWLKTLNVWTRFTVTVCRRAADQAAPPDIDVTQYGWKFDNTVLTPVAGTSATAPPSLLQSIAGSCNSTSSCANQRCSCNASGMSCSAYCKCGADDICANKHTQSMTLVEARDDTSDDEYDNDDDDYYYY